MFKRCGMVPNYTIPRNNRELQQSPPKIQIHINYTIPRNNRELQQGGPDAKEALDYTIPRNNRELQPVH